MNEELEQLYRLRFDGRDLEAKRRLWAVLCTHFFWRYVDPNDTVLDLGAGACEFANAIQAHRKIAVDLNPDTKGAADPDVEVLITPSTALEGVADGEVDVVFSSNFFEHLLTKQALLDTLREAHRVLRPGGRIVVLMPNVRYLPGAYWDYFDHHLPLTHRSLVEVLELSGFRPAEVIPRFLPYTVKGRLPARPWMVKLYLRARPLWPVLGKQMLVTAYR